MGRFQHKVAFVIATKDRPEDLRRTLRSLAGQSQKPDQIVIVDASTPPLPASVFAFRELKVRYLRHLPPSATRQRNVGVEAVDREIDLIGFLDDDIEMKPDALEAMLSFWETAAQDVGGAAFNMLNCPPRQAMWLKSLRITSWLGLYSRKGGIVTRSGFQTLTGTVAKTTFVEWLPSGAVVWRRSVLKEFSFDEWFEGYSYVEDVDFSYTVSKKYRLAVVAEAGYCHYLSAGGRPDAYSFGKIEVANRLYFVRKHNLSVLRFYLATFLRMLMSVGLALTKRNFEYARRAWGNATGLAGSLLMVRARRGGKQPCGSRCNGPRSSDYRRSGDGTS